MTTVREIITDHKHEERALWWNFDYLDIGLKVWILSHPRLDCMLLELENSIAKMHEERRKIPEHKVSIDEYAQHLVATERYENIASAIEYTKTMISFGEITGDPFEMRVPPPETDPAWKPWHHVKYRVWRLRCLISAFIRYHPELVDVDVEDE